jgi:hypothetical protein
MNKQVCKLILSSILLTLGTALAIIQGIQS